MRKAAFITGAGGYIGSETAAVLASEGIAVGVCDIDAEKAEQTVRRSTEAGGEAKAYPADVSEVDSVSAAVEQAAADFGRLDILVHAAGGSARIAGPGTKYLPLAEQDPAVIDRVLKVNLYGAFWSARAAARVMLRQGEGGRIISFASAVGFNGLKGSSDYAASKGGIMSMTKALAKELGPYHITVNAVAPGVVARPDSGATDAYKLGTNLFGLQCTARDVADLVAFLASDKARFITGATYLIDGGRTLSMKGTD